MLGFFFSFVLVSAWPRLVNYILNRYGWYAWYYGPELLQEIIGEKEAVGQAVPTRLMLWAICAAFPLQVVSVLILLRTLAGTRPAEVGLTTRRLGVNLLAGLVATCVLIPGVYGIQALMMLLTHALGLKEQPHPFAELGQMSLDPVEWVLLVLAATLVAPVWEELIFRGIVQPWVISRPWGGAFALAAALVMTLPLRLDDGWQMADVKALLVALMPVLVLLALVPVYLLLARRSRTAGGLFATAVLFAWVHASVWPSPIPLLWLALGLGWLALRRAGLAGPIMLHALFNGVACLMLLLEPYFVGK